MLIQRNGRAVQIHRQNDNMLYNTSYFTVDKKGFLSPTGQHSYTDTYADWNDYLDYGNASQTPSKTQSL